MVWDRIEHPDGDPVERWGGIAYSLAAAAAALPEGWTLSPLVKVGEDLAAQARAFLDGLPGVESSAVRVVAEPTNRVHLRYRDRQHRHETLTGGVPGWGWEELEPRLSGLDALYVNLISGFELELATARRLRASFRRPLYADLHSLLLGVDAGGARVPRELSDRDAWLSAFDVVQVNEEEWSLVAADGDPDAVARAAVGAHGGAILVTMGPSGARWYAGADHPRPWAEVAGPVASGLVRVAEPWVAGDPTGCGDVWGATCFMALLRGEGLSAAMAAANRAARRNVDHRGAEGLYGHLRNAT